LEKIDCLARHQSPADTGVNASATELPAHHVVSHPARIALAFAKWIELAVALEQLDVPDKQQTQVG